VARQKVHAHGASGRSGSETREMSGHGNEEWIRRHGEAVKQVDRNVRPSRRLVHTLDTNVKFS